MKTVTPKIHRTVPAHASIGIAYGVARDLDRVEARFFSIRIDEKGRPIPDPSTEQHDILLWIEKPLNPGDSICISAESFLGLREAVSKERNELWSISAFWTVQGDGSLVCSGT